MTLDVDYNIPEKLNININREILQCNIIKRLLRNNVITLFLNNLFIILHCKISLFIFIFNFSGIL